MTSNLTMKVTSRAALRRSELMDEAMQVQASLTLLGLHSIYGGTKCHGFWIRNCVNPDYKRTTRNPHFFTIAQTRRFAALLRLRNESAFSCLEGNCDQCLGAPDALPCPTAVLDEELRTKFGAN